MNVRTDIAEMLRDGLTDTQIAARAHVGHKTVAAARAALNIPKCRAGHKSEPSLDHLLRNRIRVVGDHWEWTGQLIRTTPVARFHGHRYTGWRIAFVVRYGRPPVGTVRPGCGHPSCVRHVADRPMREQLNTQYNAIFGGAL